MNLRSNKYKIFFILNILFHFLYGSGHTYASSTVAYSYDNHDKFERTIRFAACINDDSLMDEAYYLVTQEEIYPNMPIISTKENSLTYPVFEIVRSIGTYESDNEKIKKLESILYLYRNGLDPALIDPLSGNTLLHIATELAAKNLDRTTNQNVESLTYELFIITLEDSRRPDINTRNYLGMTAFHIAANCDVERDDIVRSVLNNGGHPDLYDFKGQLPYHYAKETFELFYDEPTKTMEIFTNLGIAFDDDSELEEIRKRNYIRENSEHYNDFKSLKKDLDDASNDDNFAMMNREEYGKFVSNYMRLLNDITTSYFSTVHDFGRRNSKEEEKEEEMEDNGILSFEDLSDDDF